MGVQVRAFRNIQAMHSSFVLSFDHLKITLLGAWDDKQLIRLLSLKVENKLIPISY